jgi:hypothetical protein
MSIEVLLIPLGIAAYSALKEHWRSDLCEGCRQTRVTERSLLVEALETLGATSIEHNGETITADIKGRSVRFQLVEGVYLGRVDSGADHETRALIATVNEAAGRVMQAAKVDEMRLRAAQLGLSLVGEEISEDGTVQLVFEQEVE